VKEMRKLDKAIIWPTYFDANKSRAEGRRVNKNLAVLSPKILELKEAADKLGLENEISLETHHPKYPWFKGGSMLIEKKEPKEQIIAKLAKQLVKIKAENQQKK
jgi:signal recognition particle subunit SRP19